MKKNIVISHFGPYGQFTENPTEIIASAAFEILEKYLTDVKVYIVSLDVSLKKIETIISGMVENLSPIFWLGLGLKSKGTGVLRFESFAKNIANLNNPDNDNFQPKDEKLIVTEDQVLSTNLNVPDIVNNLQKSHLIPSLCSYDAGENVCNAVYFFILYYLNKFCMHRNGLFIHTPHIPEIVSQYRSLLLAEFPSMSKDYQIFAIKTVIDYFLKSQK